MKKKTTKAAPKRGVVSAIGCSAPDSTGRIPSGCSCIYSHDCEVKHDACNGEGCRVSDGRISDKPFSCGYARLRKIVSRPNPKVQTEPRFGGDSLQPVVGTPNQENK